MVSKEYSQSKVVELSSSCEITEYVPENSAPLTRFKFIENTFEKKKDRNTYIKCCVPNCSHSRKSHPNLRFYQFPQNRTLEWANVINKNFPDYCYKGTHRICQSHFSDSNFTNTLYNRLSKFAIPNIFENVKEKSPFENQVKEHSLAEEEAILFSSIPPENIIEIHTSDLPSPLRQFHESVSDNSDLISSKSNILPLLDGEPNGKVSPKDFETNSSSTNELQNSLSSNKIVPKILSESKSCDELTSPYNDNEEYSKNSSYIHARCCVPKCYLSRKSNPNFHFYKFPPNKISIWADAIKRNFSDYCYKGSHRICQLHFSDSNFTNTLHNRLTMFAVPDIFKNTNQKLPSENHSSAIKETISFSSVPSENIIEIHTSNLPDPLRHYHDSLSLHEGLVSSNLSSSPQGKSRVPGRPINSSVTNISFSLNHELGSKGQSEPHQMDELSSPYNNNEGYISPKNMRCCVPNCPFSTTSNPLFRFYEFPMKRTSEWVSIIKRNYTDYSFNENDRICQSHFSDSNFTDSLLNELNKFAIPDIFGNINEQLQSEKRELSSVETVTFSTLSSDNVIEICTSDLKSSEFQEAVDRNSNLVSSQNSNESGANIFLPSLQKQYNNNLICTQNEENVPIVENLASLQATPGPCVSTNYKAVPPLTRSLICATVLASTHHEVEQTVSPVNDLPLIDISPNAHESLKTVSRKILSKDTIEIKERNITTSKKIICCVPDCSISHASNPEVHFFNFPPRRIIEWSRKIKSNFSNYRFKPGHKICQYHFSDSYFNSTSHNRLKNYAIPNVFVNKYL